MEGRGGSVKGLSSATSVAALIIGLRLTLLYAN